MSIQPNSGKYASYFLKTICTVWMLLFYTGIFSFHLNAQNILLKSDELPTVKEIVFNKEPDLSRNTPENQKAAETPQVMFSVILATQNAMPILEDYNNTEGKNVITATQSAADKFGEYCENSGFKNVDVCVLPEIVEIPTTNQNASGYDDDETQGLFDANDWSYESLENPNSWLYQKRQEIADKYNIPVEKIFFQIATEHNVGGGGSGNKLPSQRQNLLHESWIYVSGRANWNFHA